MLTPYFFGSLFAAGMEKTAAPALMRYLMTLAPAARNAVVKKLPAGLRETASYKLLGRQAADAARHLGDDVAHGAPHVFNVTRNAQQLAQYAPRGVYQRSVLGSLLHDVGRHAEIGAAHRVLAANPGLKTIPNVLEANPNLMHSELGGRYVKHWLRRNKTLARNVEGLDRLGQRDLRTAIRAHDTDAWRRIPHLGQQPGAPHVMDGSWAGRNIYVADKLDALGRRGFDRTVEMARQLGQGPAATMDFVVNKNIPKYTNIINRWAPEQARPRLHQQLDEYRGLFDDWGRQQGVPPVASPGPAAPAMRPPHRPFTGMPQQPPARPPMGGQPPATPQPAQPPAMGQPPQPMAPAAY